MNINLKSLIEDIIKELTIPTTIDRDNPNDPDQILNIDPSDTETIDNIKKDPKVKKAMMGTKKIKEGEIEEMAAPSVKYEIGDVSKIDNLKLSAKALDRVKKLAAYVDAYGPVEKSKMAAKAFDAPLSQQQINGLVDILNSVGILKVATGSEERAKQYAQSYSWSRTEKDKPEEVPTPGKASTKVSAKDIAASIASFPKGLEAEPEPDMSAMTPSVKPAAMSSAKQAAVEFFMDEKNDRLLQKIINTFSASRAKIKEIKEANGDVGGGDYNKGETDRKEKSLSEMETLIQTMADRINGAGDEKAIDEILKLLAFKLNSVGYNKLYSRIEKAVKGNISERFQQLANIK